MHKNLGAFKEASYLDYFRAFSVSTMASIRKLQVAFKQQMSDNYFFEPAKMFKRVKTMLGTYEILILQINDSFQFVEIPEFGQCILKIFLQMMSIIRWLLKSMSLRPAYNKSEGKKNERNTVTLTKTTQFQDPRQMFKIKERANFVLNDMQAQIFKIEKQQQNAETTNFGLNKQKFLKISSSDSQALIEQAVNTMIKNSEYLNQFVDLRQSSMKQNHHQNGVDMYNKIKSSFIEQSAKQIQQVKKKMLILCQEYLKNVQQQRKSRMISQQIQVKIVQKSTVQQNKIKKLQQTIKLLEKNNRMLLSQNESFKQMIEDKTMEFQRQMMEYQTYKALETIQLKTSLSQNQSRSSQRFPRAQIEPKRASQQIRKQTESYSQILKPDRSKSAFRKVRHYQTSNQSRLRIQNQDSSSDPLNSSNQNKVLQIYSEIVCENFKPTNQIKKSKLKKHRRQKSRSLVIANSINSSPENQQNSHEQIRQIQKRLIYGRFGQQVQTQLKQFDFKQTQTQNNLRAVTNFELTVDPLNSKNNSHSLNSLLKNIKNVGCKGLRSSEQNPSQQSEYLTRIQVNKKNFSYYGNSNFQRQSTAKKLTQIGETQICQKMLNATIGCKITVGNIRYRSNNQNSLKDQGLYFVLEEIKNIKFAQEDVWSIFFTEENCKNYEIVNIYKNQSVNKRPYCTKNTLKKSKYRTSNTTIRIGSSHNKKSIQFSFLNSSVILIFKQAMQLKKVDKQSYEQFRNFLRYPFSFFKHGNGQKWKELVKFQTDLQSDQVQNRIGKIFRFHSNCPKVQIKGQSICQHMLNFYKKLGISVKL